MSSIATETKGPVLTITLDRPDKKNAIDPATSDALIEAWEAFEADDDLRAAVLTGAGDAFCAGADLTKMDAWYGQVPDHERREFFDAEPGLGGITKNFEVRKPTIAAIDGACYGAGLELALACDVRLAAPGSRLGLTETKWGIIPGQGGTQRLPRLVGEGHALEMILAARPIDAARAEEIGLVNRLVDDPLAEAIDLGEQIASRSPQAVRLAKEAVRRGLQQPLEQGLRLETHLADDLRDGPDNRAAREAFEAGEEPDFSP